MSASVETCFTPRVDFNYGDIVRRGTERRRKQAR